MCGNDDIRGAEMTSTVAMLVDTKLILSFISKPSLEQAQHYKVVYTRFIMSKEEPKRRTNLFGQMQTS